MRRWYPRRTTLRLAIALLGLTAAAGCGDDQPDSSRPDASDAAAQDVGQNPRDATQDAAAAQVCTPGADQTCNDSPVISSLHGHCESNGQCTCTAGFALNPATGRCL